jgi:hypothetical protein
MKADMDLTVHTQKNPKKNTTQIISEFFHFSAILMDSNFTQLQDHAATTMAQYSTFSTFLLVSLFSVSPGPRFLMLLPFD